MTRTVVILAIVGLAGACASWLPASEAEAADKHPIAKVVDVSPTIDAEAETKGSAVDVPTPVMTTYHPMQSFAPLVEAVEPAVVAIKVEALTQPNQDLSEIPPTFRHLFSAQPRIERGEGSGFIISAAGHVLTNAHVVADADSITVLLRDGETAAATVLGFDRNMDIALLQLEGDEVWPHVELGSSSDLKVGDWVVAMGNPLGLGHTVTAGIVSAKGRVLGQDMYGNEDYIQTDAAINQGNSGGPLFDLEGRVVGMNTAIIAGANTIGFSIPSDLLSSVIAELEDEGHIRRGYLGVEPVMLTPELAKLAGVNTTQGALIKQIFAGTPAIKAGLLEGDVVVSVDDMPIAEPGDLIKAIGNKRAGETVQLEILRGAKQQRVKLKLGERPGGR